MGRKVKPRVPDDLATLRQCQQLLRHLKHPRRLRENVLAKRIWAAVGLELANSAEADLADCLEVSVRATLKYVSPRQRAIIERYDLAGEANPNVAVDLGISRRHLYRERAATIALITSHLGQEGSDGPKVTQAVPDALTLQLALAESLEQNGQWIAAAEMLESISPELQDASKHCLVEFRLAGLYTFVRRYSLADAHVRRAFEVCDTTIAPPWLRAEAALSAARLADALGDFATADRAVRHCCMELRSWSHSSHDPRVVETLLSALNLSSDMALGRGDVAAAKVVSAEALEALRQLMVARHIQRLDIGAQSDARVNAAMVGIIAGNRDRAEQDLWICYQTAVDSRQARDALTIAILLGNYFHLTGTPSRTIDLLNRLVDAARSAGSGDIFQGFFIELGSAAADVGDADLARRCLIELRNSTGMSSWVRAHAALFEAQVEFANNRFEASLKASEVAEAAFVSLGRDRLVGPCLQLQAQSLAALGDFSRAVRTMRLAIERLRATGQHYRRLVAAYLEMASLTGDPSFKRDARKAHAKFARPMETSAAGIAAPSSGQFEP